MNLFIDIETLRTEDQDTLDVLKTSAKAPANLKDPEKIAAAVEADYQKRVDRTGLDGTYGTICVIAWAVEDGPLTSSDIGNRSEAACIENFFILVEDQMKSARGRQPWFIGFNVGFDLRFIWRRSIIHGIRPPFKIPYNAAPWNNKYTDLMFEWCGAKEFIKLKELCRVLGIDCDGDIDGADVHDEWKRSNHVAVIEHCRKDVDRVREIYGRICR